MTREELIFLAEKLLKPSKKTMEEYTSKKELLIALINKKMDEESNIKKLIGINNEDIMHQNHLHHIKFMEAIFLNYNPTEFVETILWVFRVYISRGFSEDYWKNQLNNWIPILKTTINQSSFEEILPFYHFMITNIPFFAKISQEQIASKFSN